MPSVLSRQVVSSSTRALARWWPRRRARPRTIATSARLLLGTSSSSSSPRHQPSSARRPTSTGARPTSCGRRRRGGTQTRLSTPCSVELGPAGAEHCAACGVRLAADDTLHFESRRDSLLHESEILDSDRYFLEANASLVHGEKIYAVVWLCEAQGPTRMAPMHPNSALDGTDNAALSTRWH